MRVALYPQQEQRNRSLIRTSGGPELRIKRGASSVFTPGRGGNTARPAYLLRAAEETRRVQRIYSGTRRKHGTSSVFTPGRGGNTARPAHLLRDTAETRHVPRIYFAPRSNSAERA